MIERDLAAYRIERALADRLRAAPKARRPQVAREVYAELYRLVHWHSDLTLPPGDRERKALGVAYTFQRWVASASTVLEVGAGSCDLLRWFAERHPRTRFVGIDVARDPLKASAALADNVRFVQAGSAAIPFPPSRFDFVYCSQVLEHFHPDDVPEYLAEFGRVLRPGGWLGLDTPNRITGPHDVSRGFTQEPTGLHLKEWTHEELLGVLGRCGFDLVLTRAMPGRVARLLRMQPPGPLIRAARKVKIERLLARLPVISLRRALARLLGVTDVFLYARRCPMSGRETTGNLRH